MEYYSTNHNSNKIAKEILVDKEDITIYNNREE